MSPDSPNGKLYSDGGLIGYRLLHDALRGRLQRAVDQRHIPRMQANPSFFGGTYAWVQVADDDETIIKADFGYVFPQNNGVFTQEWRDVMFSETKDWGNVVQLPYTTVENNITELIAAVTGLEAMPKDWNGRLFTDNENVIKRLWHYAPMIGVPDEWQERAMQALWQVGRVRPTLLGGHPNKQEIVKGRNLNGFPCSKWNVWCDKACTRLSAAFASASKDAAKTLGIDEGKDDNGNNEQA